MAVPIATLTNKLETLEIAEGVGSTSARSAWSGTPMATTDGQSHASGARTPVGTGHGESSAHPNVDTGSSEKFTPHYGARLSDSDRERTPAGSANSPERDRASRASVLSRSSMLSRGSIGSDGLPGMSITVSGLPMLSQLKLNELREAAGDDAVSPGATITTVRPGEHDGAGLLPSHSGGLTGRESTRQVSGNSMEPRLSDDGSGIKLANDYGDSRGARMLGSGSHGPSMGPPAHLGGLDGPGSFYGNAEDPADPLTARSSRVHSRSSGSGVYASVQMQASATGMIRAMSGGLDPASVVETARAESSRAYASARTAEMESADTARSILAAQPSAHGDDGYDLHHGHGHDIAASLGLGYEESFRPGYDAGAPHASPHGVTPGGSMSARSTGSHDSHFRSSGASSGGVHVPPGRYAPADAFAGSYPVHHPEMSGTPGYGYPAYSPGGYAPAAPTAAPGGNRTPAAPLLHPEDITKDMKSMRCRNCGDFGHMMRYCPRVVCFTCHCMGHMASVCPYVSVTPVRHGTPGSVMVSGPGGPMPAAYGGPHPMALHPPQPVGYTPAHVGGTPSFSPHGSTVPPPHPYALRGRAMVAPHTGAPYGYGAPAYHGMEYGGSMAGPMPGPFAPPSGPHALPAGFNPTALPVEGADRSAPTGSGLPPLAPSIHHMTGGPRQPPSSYGVAFAPPRGPPPSWQQ